MKQWYNCDILIYVFALVFCKKYFLKLWNMKYVFRCKSIFGKSKVNLPEDYILSEVWQRKIRTRKTVQHSSNKSFEKNCSIKRVTLKWNQNVENIWRNVERIEPNIWTRTVGLVSKFCDVLLETFQSSLPHGRRFGAQDEDVEGKNDGK